MAITNYSELQAAIENTTSGWMFQEALGGRTTDFIAMCEAEMQSILAQSPVRPMQKRATATIDAEYVAIPADYLLADAFELDLSPEWRITYVEPEDMARLRSSEQRRRDELNELYGSTPAPPENFTVIGNEFRFFPTPQASYTGELTYFARIPALSGSNTTNWLLTNHPTAYLFGSLVAAATFTRDSKLLGTMSELFAASMAGIQSAYPKPSSKAQLRNDDMPPLARSYYL